MKLHLGCGERYLDGYLNIDFPPDQHTVQERQVADQKADLLGLTYPRGSIDEVRLHHVFEHFTRHAACALVASWQSWLRTGGGLRIEVPDLVKTGLAAINPFSSVRRRGVAERHLFGSHEADWAAHREGYSVGVLSDLVCSFGFVVDRVRRNSWRGTYNFELQARKARDVSRTDCEAATRRYLRQFLVDDSASETRLLEAWMGLYARQIERSWARAS